MTSCGYCWSTEQRIIGSDNDEQTPSRVFCGRSRLTLDIAIFFTERRNTYRTNKAYCVTEVSKHHTESSVSCWLLHTHDKHT